MFSPPPLHHHNVLSQAGLTSALHCIQPPQRDKEELLSYHQRPLQLDEAAVVISKNQHFLFHLIQSYYILFLLFWG